MRYIKKFIAKDLQNKMVFVGGPRQVGKTTLAKDLLKNSKGNYFNWDFDEDRENILQKKWQKNDELIIFDELHKFPRWKNWIKGIWDKLGENHSFLITGSARLDIYKKGGDSLMGRYHYWRLHPFSLDEIPDSLSKEEALGRLMNLGGFPEPFLNGDETFARRWRKERFDRVIREDIRDLTQIRDLGNLRLFLDILRRRVGSTIQLNNIATELQVSYKTLVHWLKALESMYLIFVVRPFTRSLPRAVSKPFKVYFFDNGDVVGDEGAKFENLIANFLLKKIHFLEDSEGFRYELRYIRDKEGREVDFIVLRDDKISEIIEVKFGDENLSKSLIYYAKKLNLSFGQVKQVVANLDRSYDRGEVQVLNPFELI